EVAGVSSSSSVSEDEGAAEDDDAEADESRRKSPAAAAAAVTTAAPHRSAHTRRTPKLFSSKYFLRVNTGAVGPGPRPGLGAAVPTGLVRVCHYAFLSIHGIGKKRVNNLIAHAFAHRKKAAGESMSAPANGAV